jgi:hypothetical protein
MTELNCECSCKQISFNLKYYPKEIAQCYCSICANLSKNKFMAFVKCDIKLLKTINLDKLYIYNSSTRAKRGLCKECNDSIFMQYTDSKNLWINVKTFKFSYDNIETYDIYK